MTTTAPARPTGPYRRVVSVAGVSVRDRLPVVGVVAALLVGLSALSGALWPALQETFAALPDGFADLIGDAVAGGDLTTPAGWVTTQTLSVVAPAALAVIALLTTARGIGGEEEDGTLGVLLSVPLARTTFVLAKLAAMVVAVALGCVALVAGLLLANPVGDLGLSVSGILAATVHLGLLATLVGAATALAAALTGSFRTAAAGGAAVFGLSFLVATFAPLVEAVEPLARISPFYYATSSAPLTNGVDVVHLLVLAAVTVVLGATAVLVHRRRDLR